MSILIHRQGVAQSVISGAGLRKAELTVQEATPAGFEAFVDNNVIGTGHEFWDNVQADGGDIRFYTDSALTTRLPLEIEALDKGAKTCRLWTRLPSALSALDTTWLGYGNTGSALSQPAAGATFGSQEVYQDDHLRGHDPGVDLTGGITPTINGTAIGSGPNGGPARGFGVTHGVDVNDNIDNNTTTVFQPYTYAAWVYVEDDGGTNRLIIGKSNGSSQIRRNSSGALEVTQNFSGGAGVWRGGSIPLDTWTHVAVAYDASDPANDPTLYINGSPASLSFDSNTTGTPTVTTDWWDGSVNFTPQSMDGLIAERMYRSGALSAAHIAALYSNQNAVGSFWSLAAGQAV